MLWEDNQGMREDQTPVEEEMEREIRTERKKERGREKLRKKYNGRECYREG